MLALLPRAAILPRLDSVKVDLAALAFVCGLTLLVSLLFSLLPLLQMSRNRPYDLLKMEGRSLSTGKSKRRLGQMFVVSEFVVSLVLLILGSAAGRELLKLQRVDPGFRASNLLVFHIPVPEVNYGKFIDGNRDVPREKLYEQLEQIVGAVPGVESVAFTAGLPLQQEFNPWGVRIEGHELPPSGSEGDTGIQMVNPQFFHALGLKLVSGRFLDEHDKADEPMAAVVNESFARTFFRHEDPIGKRVTVWYGKATIVGVVADFKLNALDRKPYPEIFWSIRQAPSRNVWIMARTKSDPSLLDGAVRQKIQDFDSDLPVLEMQSMTEVIAGSLWLKRLSADLIGLVAVLAIILAGTGIYSVMSYSVSQREKEMGIRIAFGADQHDVLGLIMGEACRLALLGSVLGSRCSVHRRSCGDEYFVPSAVVGIESISERIESGGLCCQLAILVCYRDLRQLCTRPPRLARRSRGCVTARMSSPAGCVVLGLIFGSCGHVAAFHRPTVVANCNWSKRHYFQRCCSESPHLTIKSAMRTGPTLNARATRMKASTADQAGRNSRVCREGRS